MPVILRAPSGNTRVRMDRRNLVHQARALPPPRAGGRFPYASTSCVSWDRRLGDAGKPPPLKFGAWSSLSDVGISFGGMGFSRKEDDAGVRHAARSKRCPSRLTGVEGGVLAHRVHGMGRSSHFLSTACFLTLLYELFDFLTLLDPGSLLFGGESLVRLYES